MKTLAFANGDQMPILGLGHGRDNVAGGIEQSLQDQIQLSAADMERIAGLDRNYCLIDGSFWVLEGGPWTVQKIWDSA